MICLPPFPLCTGLFETLSEMYSKYIYLHLPPALTPPPLGDLGQKCISTRGIILLWAFEVNFAFVDLRNQKTQFISIPEIHLDKLQQRVGRQSTLLGILILSSLLLMLRTGLIDTWYSNIFLYSKNESKPWLSHSILCIFLALPSKDRCLGPLFEETCLAVWSLQKCFKLSVSPTLE